MDEKEMLNEIFGKVFNETKQEITEKYIKGIINKNDFLMRMKNAKE